MIIDIDEISKQWKLDEPQLDILGEQVGPPVLCLAITGHLLIRLSGRHPARSAR